MNIGKIEHPTHARVHLSRATQGIMLAFAAIVLFAALALAGGVP